MNKEYRLCYIDGNTVYFTTQDLDKQWGDDWDDAPYYCNAGTPYGPSVHYYADGRKEKDPRDWNVDGTPKWEIQTLRYECNYLDTPENKGFNVSVIEINGGAVAWLYGSKMSEDGRRMHVAVHAGATIEEFKEKVKLMGGKIYVEEEE